MVYPVPVMVPAPAPEVPEAAEHAPRTSTSRRGRAKVPSWDEIVFGAKPE